MLPMGCLPERGNWKSFLVLPISDSEDDDDLVAISERV